MQKGALEPRNYIDVTSSGKLRRHRGLHVIGGTLGWPEGRPESLVNPSDILPSPGRSGIKHIVVVTMENRSFDHFLGWFPNAEGRQINTYPTPGNGTMSTYPLAPDYQGCGHPNPDHSYAGGASTMTMEQWMDGC